MEEDSQPLALEVYRNQLDKDWKSGVRGSWTSSPKLPSNLNYSINLENTISFLLQENNTVGLLSSEI